MKHFLRERLEFYLRDALGFKYDVVNAVLAADADDVVDAVARAEAVTKVRPSAGLRVDLGRVQTHARTSCGKQPRRESTSAAAVDAEALPEPAERELASANSADCKGCGLD